jgi:glycosyltransferase involved in cell wall biosynthesis
MKSDPVAIVIPWFGKELKGGAEQLAWQVATKLAERGHQIEVLTTCCRTFHEDWANNDLPAGSSRDGQVTIKRFPVDSRDRQAFDRVNLKLLSLPPSCLKPGVSPISSQDSSIFAQENINSSSFLSYLTRHSKDYRAFIFLPYLYGLILNGLPIVADRAYLQPCLHDEAYAYLSEVEDLFRCAKRLLFNSEGEAQLAERLYGPGIIQRTRVIGSGIETSVDSVPDSLDRIRDFHLRKERFVLYLGRRDVTKNTDLLIRAFKDYHQRSRYSDLKLVLAGPGNNSFAEEGNNIIDLGLVTNEERDALLRNCRALVQPSRHESYSRTIMEAWSQRHPVVVHRECMATSIAVEAAQGGWLAGSEREWAETLATLASMGKEELNALGENGERYAREFATWAGVIDRYETVLGESTGGEFLAERNLKEVHQVLPVLAYGDAISNHAIAIRDHCRDLGYRSEIFAAHVDTRVSDQCRVFGQGEVSQDAGLFYHHSIGSELSGQAARHPGPKCLIYHNITPPEFFEPYWPEFAEILKCGRSELRGLSLDFRLAVGDSAYNASELKDIGFPQPTVLPIIIDPDRWNIRADSDLMRQLQDGRTNLLFVGRIAPNKKQDEIVRAFAQYLLLDRNARLILVGKAEANDPYYSHVLETIQILGLDDYVLLSGSVRDDQLLAYYRTAHLYWSMSEHEGFGAPIVEAMWFDIPVLAFKSTAIPETLGKAAVMFTNKTDLISIAAFANQLVQDFQLRKSVLKAQRKRRVDFLPERVWEKLHGLLKEMEPSPAKRWARNEVGKKVAFVVQRCGQEVNGGAEALCLRIAERMSVHWNVEVLATCALDYMTWENHYQPGVDNGESVRIRRFRVDRPRDLQGFNRLSSFIRDHPKVSLNEQEQWMLAQGPRSSDLIAYVDAHQDRFDAFIFFSYLYASTYFVLPLVEHKAYLVPLAHDEWPIYLSLWDRFFKRPRKLLFNTPEEREFLQRRFPEVSMDGPVAGFAVEPSADHNAERFRKRYGLSEPFLLYLGRIDPSKGCEELFDYFAAFRKRETCPRKLVLLGKAAMPVPDHPDIISLGFVDELTKWDALAACDLLVMPSAYESLSIVLLEAWGMRRPVLVNGTCDVLVGQCKRANGGLWYESFDEFEACLSLLVRNPDLRRKLGESGKRFVTGCYSWDRIEEKYLELVSN